MSIPEPEKGESEGEFVSRCIASLTESGEFESERIRTAVCFDAFGGGGDSRRSGEGGEG